MKKNTMNQTALKIILVDENMGRSAILRRALQDKGHEVISRLEESENLANSNEITHADVVIVNADIPDEAVFANLRDVNKTKPKPIVMFTESSEEHMAGTAIKSGVNAYIVDGLEEKRVQPIIDVAIARFREFQALKDELDATRSQLAERKSIVDNSSIPILRIPTAIYHPIMIPSSMIGYPIQYYQHISVVRLSNKSS